MIEDEVFVHSAGRVKEALAPTTEIDVAPDQSPSKVIALATFVAIAGLRTELAATTKEADEDDDAASYVTEAPEAPPATEVERKRTKGAVMPPRKVTLQDGTTVKTSPVG